MSALPVASESRERRERGKKSETRKKKNGKASVLLCVVVDNKVEWQ